MFKRGPIPPLVHGVIDYAFGVVLIAAPFVLDFTDNAATALAIALGLCVLILAAFTSWTAGIVKSVPVAAHVMLDYALSIFLIAAPFLFGFNNDDTASACFVVLGILGLLLTIATRYVARAPRTQPTQPTPPPPATPAT